MSTTNPRFDHVGLNVRDLESQADWYRAAFGYREQLRLDLTGPGLQIVMLIDDDGRRFELITGRGGTDGLRAANPVEAAATWGYGHVAFRLEDLQATYDRLLGLGARTVAAPGPSPEAGFWFAWVHDPEGNLLELIGPAPQ